MKTTYFFAAFFWFCVAGMTEHPRVFRCGNIEYIIGDDQHLYENPVGRYKPNIFEPLATISVVDMAIPVDSDATYAHFLVLDSQARVWSWGYNFFGQVGFNSAGRSTLLPRIVPNLNNIISIKATHSQSIALDSEGKVWIFGFIGFDAYSSIPIEVSLPAIKSVAIHEDTILALDHNGAIWRINKSNSATVSTVTATSIDNIPKSSFIASRRGSTFLADEHGEIWKLTSSPWRAVKISEGIKVSKIFVFKNCQAALSEEGKAYFWGTYKITDQEKIEIDSPVSLDNESYTSITQSGNEVYLEGPGVQKLVRIPPPYKLISFK